MTTATELNCIIEGRSSTFSECSSLSFVSHCGDQFTPIDSERGSISPSPKWKRLMKNLIKESKKSLYGSSSKPVGGFSYDAVSYSLNFDDGTRGYEYYFSQSRCSSSQIPDECL